MKPQRQHSFAFVKVEEATLKPAAGKGDVGTKCVLHMYHPPTFQTEMVRKLLFEDCVRLEKSRGKGGWAQNHEE